MRRCASHFCLMVMKCMDTALGIQSRSTLRPTLALQLPDNVSHVLVAGLLLRSTLFQAAVAWLLVAPPMARCGCGMLLHARVCMKQLSRCHQHQQQLLLAVVGALVVELVPVLQEMMLGMGVTTLPL